MSCFFRNTDSLTHPLTHSLGHHQVRKPVNYSIMAVNIPGVIAMVVFYLAVLLTGIWASFKSKRKQKKTAASTMEMALLGNRGISLVVGVFTMTGEKPPSVLASSK